MSIADIPLPPAPPPLPPTEWTAEQWDRAWSYADLLLRIEAAKRAEAEAEVLRAWRESETDKNRLCVQMKQQIINGFLPAVEPTLNRIADALDAFDAALNRVADGLGAPPPRPPAPPPFDL